MKKLLTAALMLFALTANAATWTWDGTKNVQSTAWPCDNVWPVSNSGITATFGSAFTYSQINPPEPTTCDEPGFYTDGQWRPEGWGQWAVKMNWNCVPGGLPPPGYPAGNGIQFSTPIRTFSVDIIGGTVQHYFSCLDYVCSTDGGVTWNTHCTLPLDGSITSTANLEMWNAGPVISAAVAYVDGVAGCIVDPPAQTPPADDYDWSNNPRPFCNRQRVTIVSPIPVIKVYFKGFNASTWGTHLYLDNFEASTTAPPCQNPPCEFESIAPPIEGVADTGQRPAEVVPQIMFRQVDVTPAQRSSWGRLKMIYR